MTSLVNVPLNAFRLMTSLNLGATLLIPSHIKPDENALNNGESVTKTVAGNISYKNVPTMEV